MNPESSISFVFFGTDEFSVTVLEELEKEYFLPALIVAPPDKPKGRGLALTPPPIKIWAARHSIEILQPLKLDSNFLSSLTLYPKPFTLFVVASYGKIIPQAVLDIPEKGTLNAHPSLLPKYRGPSPVESQILDDEKEVGVSIMLLDKEMDHGPILAQEKIAAVSALPMPSPVLSRTLAQIGGRILAKTIPLYLSGELVPIPQNHDLATICKKITKEDGLIDLADNQRKNYLKFLAFQNWPTVYFFAERKGKKIRVIIKDAYFENNKFKIKNVLPEGGRLMPYEDFLRGN